MNNKEQQVDEVLERGTIVTILPDKESFRARLLTEKLRFYIGFDATAPTLHLSHAKNIMLLEKFRKLGHEVIVLFGDFTARIGDPTGEKSSRKQLSREEVLKNVAIWRELIKPLMDFEDKENPPLIKFNNDWLSKLTFEDVINLAGNFTVQQMLEREMFEKRITTGVICRHCKNKFTSPIQFSKESFTTVQMSGNTTTCPNCNKTTNLDKEDLIFETEPIYLNEFLYPLMQGYDSVAMDVDVEMCGTDQIFNALAGRTLLKKLKQKEKFVVAVTLMENPKTKELMSKSKGTGVFLDTTANEKFGQIMAQPDEMTKILFVNCTLLGLSDIDEIMKVENPRDSKMRLAKEIVKLYHGENEAINAEGYFINVISEKNIPEDVLEVKVEEGIKVTDMIVNAKLAESKSDARRKIEHGAVEIDGEKITDWKIVLDKSYSNKVLKVGKKDFVKIVF